MRTPVDVSAAGLRARGISRIIVAVALAAVARPMAAQQSEPVRAVEPGRSYLLGTGDLVHVTVFQQPDMTTDTRVAETGAITFPLVGAVEVGGGTAKQAEERIARLLKGRGFMKDPQVNVTVVQFNSQQVSVLGHVNRPGRFPLQEGTYYLTDLIALAGGTAPDAADTVTLVRLRAGKLVELRIDLPGLFRSGGSVANPEVMAGDTIFVDRCPYFYVYGEVQRPGAYRLEKDMTVMQAVSVGGGLTLRASKKDIQVSRRDANGKASTFAAPLMEVLLPDDVIFVRESLF